mmetsp:Transcript_9399/g.30666  ORF Transcript_9399/g.30666 Transcript_9399/m.30666 type:complete len:213 (+) Transcript_9399:87-725(+)
MNVVILQALFLATGLVLLIDIVRHAHGCIGTKMSSPEVLKQRALEHRLESMEAEVKENSLLLQNFLMSLEKQFSLSEVVDLRDLKRRCHDEAKVVVAKLAEDPPPPMPNFDTAEELDGLLKVDDRYDDDVFRGQGGADLPSVKERMETCQGWRLQYAVAPGVSWGSLPLDLQETWRAYDCDIYLQEAVKAILAEHFDDDKAVIGDINSVRHR